MRLQDPVQLLVALDHDETLGRDADLQEREGGAAGAADALDERAGTGSRHLARHGAAELTARGSDGADPVRRLEPAHEEERRLPVGLVDQNQPPPIGGPCHALVLRSRYDAAGPWNALGAAGLAERHSRG